MKYRVIYGPHKGEEFELPDKDVVGLPNEIPISADETVTICGPAGSRFVTRFVWRFMDGTLAFAD